MTLCIKLTTAWVTRLVFSWARCKLNLTMYFWGLFTTLRRRTKLDSWASMTRTWTTLKVFCWMNWSSVFRERPWLWQNSTSLPFCWWESSNIGSPNSKDCTKTPVLLTLAYSLTNSKAWFVRLTNWFLMMESYLQPWPWVLMTTLSELPKMARLSYSLMRPILSF